MARQFQGYARGRGFSSRSPGAGAVSRIQEQGNKTIQGLRQQLQSKRQQDQQYASDLDSNFRRGQAINQEIKRFEDKAFDVKMSNVKQNQQRSLDNIKTEAANQATLNKQLSEFSKTLGDSVTDTIETIEKVEAEASAITLQLYGSNLPSYGEEAVEEELRQKSTKNENEFAQISRENGLPDDVRQRQRASDPHRQVKDKRANVAGAWDDYFRRATPTNYGPGLAHEIFKERGLIGANPRLFKEFAERFEKLNSAYDTKQRKARAVNISAELGSKADAQFLNIGTSQTLTHAIQTHKNGTEKGEGPRNFTLALDHAFEKLLTHEKFSDQQVLDLLQNTHLYDEDGNQLPDTLYSRFKDTRVVKLLNERAKNRIEAVDLEKKKLDAENKENFVQVMTALDKVGEEGPVDFYAYKPEIDDVSMSQDQRNKALEKLYEVSKQRVNNQPLVNEIERLRSIGQDYTDVANKLEGQERYKYLNLASQENQKKKEAGINDASDRRQIKDALIKKLNQQNIGDDKDPSLHPALEDAMVNIGKNTENNPQGAGTYADARKLAVELELQMIDAGTGRYEVKGMAKGNSNSTDNYFVYYSPGGKYFTQVVKQNPSQLMTTVRNRPDIRRDTFLTTQDNLTKHYNAISNNQPVELGYALQQINKAYPDTLQLQLDKYAVQNNLPRVTVPLTQNQFLAANEKDPLLKQFALRMDTIEEERIFPVAADESARSHPRFKTDAVNQHISFMQVAPADGGITGLTVQDYQELAYAVSAEAQRGTDDEFAVAASILNRLASGRHGSTVAEVIRRPGQYEAVYLGLARYEPQLAQRLASPEGQRMIVAMLQKLQGRTDYKGQTQLKNRDASDPMFSDRGNFYHYAGQSAGSGAYQGPIDTSYERFIN